MKNCAQCYFFFFTKETFSIIEKRVCILKQEDFIAETANILDDIKNIILEFADRFWVPIIIEEYVSFCNSSRNLGYKDFFLRRELWQRKNNRIIDKYTYELYFLKRMLQKEKRNMCLFLDRFFKDYSEICSGFGIDKPLEKISGNLSDRHGVGSVLELSFCGGQKIIYKPRSAINDLFLTDYVKTLNLDSVYRMRIPRAIDKRTYSWSEFIEYKACENNKSLESFYRNAGATLAILDSLNYTDGHNENFICSSPFLYLIDSETILTNLSYFNGRVDFFYGLEFTGMVRRLKNKELSVSAFQFNDQIAYMPASPFVENDCTENICLHYKTFRYMENVKSYPRYQKINLKKYISLIQEGMNVAYKEIAKSKSDLIKVFEKYSSKLRLRQIHRHTIYYYWLLYKFHHPCNLSKNSFLNKNLRNCSDDVLCYEKKMLTNGNVPIFFHKPHQKHIYSSNKKLQKKYYQYTATYCFYKKLNDIQHEKFRKNRLIEISNLLTI